MRSFPWIGYVRAGGVLGCLISVHCASSDLAVAQMSMFEGRSDPRTGAITGATVGDSALEEGVPGDAMTGGSGAGWGSGVAGFSQRSGFQIPNDPIHKVWQDEATLRSIAAVSEDRLVAVGDRGVILTTDDAGRSWRRIASPTSVNLYDVHFQGPNGWIVGGWVGKHTATSYSVMLHTNDGGRNWQLSSAEGLPKLVGLLVAGNRLIAWGDYSVQHGSSVFESIDGGLSWRPVIRGLTHANALAQAADGRLLAVDRLGKAADSEGSLEQISDAQAHVRSVAHCRQGWVAVGEAGQIMLGKEDQTWSDVELPLDRSIRRLCTWNFIGQHGNHLWIVGSPGSLVLNSSDGGLTWNAFPTRQSLPLNRVCFIDPNRGWAVGAQGTIIATRDGGKTWYPQRTRPNRVSLLSIVSRSGDIPWPALAATVWDQKQCAAVVCLQHDEAITAADFRLNQESINGYQATQIGMSDFQVCHIAEPGSKAEIARLALRILAWRPDVILSSNPPHPYSEVQLPSLVGEAIQLADSEEFEKTIAELHLPKWQVRKWVAVSDSNRAEYSEQSQRVLRDVGLALWDILLALPDEERKRNSEVAMRTIWTRSKNRTSHTDLMGGIAKHAETTLKEEIGALGNYQLVMGRLHRQRMLNELANADAELIGDETWVKEFQFFAHALPIRESSENLIQLVELLLERRQLGRAQLVLEWLVQRTGVSKDLHQWVLWRQLQLMGSHEWQTWSAPSSADKGAVSPSTDMAEKSAVTVAAAARESYWSHTPFDPVSNAVGETPSGGTGLDETVVAASAEQMIMGEPAAVSKAENKVETPQAADVSSWLSLAESIFQKQPTLRFQPDVLMQLASKHRQLGHKQKASEIYKNLLDLPQLVSWNQAAKQEISLLGEQGPQLRWSIQADYALKPPRLDGDFSESIWQNGTEMRLTDINQTLENPTTILWAYDKDYLYLGLHCPTPSKKQPTKVAEQRYYDADLDGIDHVVLTIDVDRDYSTAIELAIAENGLTYERCAGFQNYNPKWYVHVTNQVKHWRAEIAIPLKELTHAEIQPGTIWAVSARRLNPSDGPQSWSQIKTHRQLLEASGILIFR